MSGHSVSFAEDGGLALEAVAEADGGFDLLLSDIKMPVMDGIGLALSVSSAYPDLKIMLMTGFADQRERAHGLDALVYDVLNKPFSLAQLVEKVADALAGRPVEIRLAGAVGLGFPPASGFWSALLQSLPSPPARGAVAEISQDYPPFAGVRCIAEVG